MSLFNLIEQKEQCTVYTYTHLHGSWPVCLARFQISNNIPRIFFFSFYISSQHLCFLATVFIVACCCFLLSSWRTIAIFGSRVYMWTTFFSPLIPARYRLIQCFFFLNIPHSFQHMINGQLFLNCVEFFFSINKKSTPTDGQSTYTSMATHVLCGKGKKTLMPTKKKTLTSRRSNTNNILNWI